MVNGVSITLGPTKKGQVVAVDNNILAYNRQYVISSYQCPKAGYSQFSFDTNIVYQDRTSQSIPAAAIQGGDTYLGSPVGFVQTYKNNDYWNSTENFASTTGFNAENSWCQNKLFYDLAGWQALGEDTGSVSLDPGFTNPHYPVDDYSFVTGPPSIGFVPFNTSGTCSTCPGRNLPVLMPPAVPESFPTAPFPASAF